jgi:glycolate oxidase FAD binding subunit
VSVSVEERLGPDGTTLFPATEKEAAALIGVARAQRRSVALAGGGTRQQIGRPAPAGLTVSTRALAGICFYEPAEMVIAASAGTPLRVVEETLAAQGQYLSFEPMDHRALLRSEGEPTVGAVAACNISGPRRVCAGAARDCLIGLRLITGRGDIVGAGGRVMKNVTGLDLVKLNAGAYGTLGLITQVTFRVWPRPVHAATLVLLGLADTTAIEALSAALRSPFEVSGAAHLPAGMGATSARTLIRIENSGDAIDYRIGALRQLLIAYGDGQVLMGESAAQLWRAVRDVEFLAEPRDRAIWRVSVAPSEGAKFVQQLAASAPLPHFYDWGGGLIWISHAADGDVGAARIRAALRERGGHATLVRATTKVRTLVPVFEPLSDAVMRLTRGIKTSFDPDGILNVGRMYAGM